MKLHFYGADRCVTGSCHCLEINGKRILVDCGLQQGRDELDNAMFAFNPGDIDILLVTHAHIDHTGRIPLLVKRGFTGRILTTRVTADLMRIMLLDSAHIQESDAEYRNRKGQRAGREPVEPLYTTEDAMNVFKFLTVCEYGQTRRAVRGRERRSSPTRATCSAARASRSSLTRAACTRRSFSPAISATSTSPSSATRSF